MEGSFEDMRAFVTAHPGLFVITGAGISRASGIPAYRDAAGIWQSSSPIQHEEFMRDAAIRQRYWTRSFHGWPIVAKARPNQSHRALAHLEQKGYIQMLVTQNIDRLHQKADHKRVIDLHGRLDQVLCMDCGALYSRVEIQRWLSMNNPHLQETAVESAPDGDARVQDEAAHMLRIPSCQRCGGMLKPNVVFYGGSVRTQMVNELSRKLEQADAVLAIGSSLMVYSSFRFCIQARQQNIPILCINQGLTRADSMLALKLRGDCAEILTRLVELLPPRH